MSQAKGASDRSCDLHLEPRPKGATNPLRSAYVDRRILYTRQRERERERERDRGTGMIKSRSLAFLFLATESKFGQIICRFNRTRKLPFLDKSSLSVAASSILRDDATLSSCSTEYDRHESSSPFRENFCGLGLAPYIPSLEI